MSTTNARDTTKRFAGGRVETMPEGGRVFAHIYGACFCLVLSFAAGTIRAQESETQPPPAPQAEDTPTHAPQPAPPPYQLNRQDEDWGMMRDSSRRADWSDELKYIPLGEREGWYVSIGGLDLTLPRGVSLTADWVFYWRQSLRDGVYSVPGNLLRTGRLSSARFIGHQPGVEIHWRADRHTTFSLSYARFLARRFLRETPPGENTTFFAAWMTYRF